MEQKSCPFCGSKYKPDWIYYSYAFYHIVCDGCGAAIKRRKKQELFEAWNKRETEEVK